jgi:hypothetical protein
MTPLAALEPMLEVLPPTGTGKARSLKVYRGLKAEGYACDTVFVVEEQGRRGCESYGVEEFPANGGRGFYVRKPFADDRRLIQGGTTTPPPLMCMRDFPVEAGCLLGYCGAVAHGGIGVATVGQVEEAFVRFCFDADNAVGEPAYCRNLLNFWDDTPRPAARVLVLEEVAYTLAGRGIGNAPDPLLAGGAGPVGVAAVGVAGESVAA